MRHHNHHVEFCAGLFLCLVNFAQPLAKLVPIPSQSSNKSLSASIYVTAQAKLNLAMNNGM